MPSAVSEIAAAEAPAGDAWRTVDALRLIQVFSALPSLNTILGATVALTGFQLAVLLDDTVGRMRRQPRLEALRCWSRRRRRAARLTLRSMRAARVAEAHMSARVRSAASLMVDLAPGLGERAPRSSPVGVFCCSMQQSARRGRPAPGSRPSAHRAGAGEPLTRTVEQRSDHNSTCWRISRRLGQILRIMSV